MSCCQGNLLKALSAPPTPPLGLGWDPGSEGGQSLMGQGDAVQLDTGQLHMAHKGQDLGSLSLLSKLSIWSSPETMGLPPECCVTLGRPSLDPLSCSG